MMAAHAARLIPFSDRPLWARDVLLYEPVIPSLFLLLVGLSLALSLRAARAADRSGGAWYARQARRAVGLWAISVLFFVAEYGVRLPDALLSGGILALIAFSILVVGALLLLPGRGIFLPLALAAGCCALLRLDLTENSFYPFTSGSAPLLPMSLFALTGAWIGLSAGSRRGTAMRDAAGIAGAVTAVWLIVRFGALALFTRPFGRGDAGRDLAAPLFPSGIAMHAGFYNLRSVLALTCLGIQLAALTVLGAALKKVPEKAARHLFALGRHSLAVYVFHLSILAVIVTLFGRQPLTAISGTGTWIGLILACQTGAFFLGAKKRV